MPDIDELRARDIIKSIFTVTTLRHIASGQTRCVGFFFNESDAIQEVVNNSMDINECGYYPYCVIEELGEGIYFFPRQEIWFEWDHESDTYVKISEKPKRYNQVCCFGIG